MARSQDSTAFDRPRAEAFAQRFMGTLNEGAVCLMVSIGHRTGLFDVMRDLPPSRSSEIAARAHLSERYVREWLGAMTTGGIVEVDPDTDRFSLPTEHAAYLTRGALADNMACFAQYIGVLGGVEDDIVECFKHGGGVPYARYPRFHEVMEEDSQQSVLSSLESDILTLVPELTARLASGVRVLDAGCGRGLVAIRLAELYPRSQFVGVDLSEEAIAYARTEATARGLQNVEFVVADLSDFDRTAEPTSFDLVTTFDAVHDQAWPRNLLKGIHRTLKPDGLYLMQDINGSSDVHKNLDHPLGPFLYAVSCMHCMTVSLAQGGEGLGAMWGVEKTREYLEKAGFRSVETHRLAHNVTNNVYVAWK
jgi:2-polyprenyl-3-methyl-5-hydroxy-6-metoxy-1,4-benzoquinol methylase